MDSYSERTVKRWPPPQENPMLFTPRLTLLAVALCATAAQAELRTEKALPLALANQIAAAGVAACQANGYAVTVTVVDRAGGVRAVQRADNAGAHTLEASRAKAWTSASARNTTLAMMENAQKNPAAANLVNIPGFLLLGGGVPIKAGNEVVGAVGIGGAPGGHLDEQCAMAALDQVKAQLQ
ncbi:heme-binding protein [Ideonella sp. 4Y11]|uniref:Heme-binding protein n=2 Tax=Ideonella aquatica TaxID=2824119 RepID=A0A940YQE2_9BURK|nr:heme-binding protein [Ideonella aquatica]